MIATWTGALILRRGPLRLRRITLVSSEAARIALKGGPTCTMTVSTIFPGTDIVTGGSTITSTGMSLPIISTSAAAPVSPRVGALVAVPVVVSLVPVKPILPPSPFGAAIFQKFYIYALDQQVIDKRLSTIHDVMIGTAAAETSIAVRCEGLTSITGGQQGRRQRWVSSVPF